MGDFMSGYKTYDTSKGYGSRSQWKKAFRDRMTDQEAKEIMDECSDSPYSVLGVDLDASQSTITSAYRKLIKLWHPDRCNAPNAVEMARKIIAAYTILKQ
jgi:DnaJ-class molecular chaperone